MTSDQDHDTSSHHVQHLCLVWIWTLKFLFIKVNDQTSKWDKQIYIWKDINATMDKQMNVIPLHIDSHQNLCISLCVYSVHVYTIFIKNPFTSFRKHVWTKRNIKTSDSWTWWFNVPPLPLNLNLQWVIINLLVEMEE